MTQEVVDAKLASLVSEVPTEGPGGSFSLSLYLQL